MSIETQKVNELLLLTGCINQDSKSQKQLYDHFKSQMYSLCFRYAKNRDDAEDMLQEGFIKVFTQINQFRNEGHLEGWIRRIMVRTCINFLKKNKKFAESLDIIHAISATTYIETTASIIQAKQVIQCIRLLPLGYKLVMNLYAIEGYSHREIGELLGITEGTSRSQYTRAKVALEELLIKNKIINSSLKSNTNAA